MTELAKKIFPEDEGMQRIAEHFEAGGGGDAPSVLPKNWSVMPVEQRRLAVGEQLRESGTLDRAPEDAMRFSDEASA